MIKVSDEKLRRAFPHRIPDSVRFGDCPACAGSAVAGKNFGSVVLDRNTPAPVYRCDACEGTGKRTVHPRGA